MKNQQEVRVQRVMWRFSNRHVRCQERAAHEIPGVVEVDDRLPVWDLPDGDACGLQIFELLGRGVACC